MISVLQPWVEKLPLMQQTVLLTCIRGPDGLPKEHVTKYLLRWLRRSVLLSALDHEILSDPYNEKGGNFTGPSFHGSLCPQFISPADEYHVDVHLDWETPMTAIVKQYLKVIDEIPLHFHFHLMDAVKILGYKHEQERIRAWWFSIYTMLVKDLHLHVETMEELDYRLADNKEQWLARRVVS